MVRGPKSARDVKVVEEIIGGEADLDSMIGKLPPRIRAIMRKSNWIDSYKEMLDDDPWCSGNYILNYFCLKTVREGQLVLA